MPRLNRCATMREDGEQCPRYDTVAITAGCVHEHIADGWVCMDDLSKALSEDLACSLCLWGDDPHECLIRVLSRETVDG